MVNGNTIKLKRKIHSNYNIKFYRLLTIHAEEPILFCLSTKSSYNYLIFFITYNYSAFKFYAMISFTVIDRMELIKYALIITD